MSLSTLFQHLCLSLLLTYCSSLNEFTFSLSHSLSLFISLFLSFILSLSLSAYLPFSQITSISAQPALKAIVNGVEVTDIVEGSNVTFKCESSGGTVPDLYQITKIVAGGDVIIKAFTAGSGMADHVLSTPFAAGGAGSYICVTKRGTAGAESLASEPLVLTLKCTF